LKQIKSHISVVTGAGSGIGRATALALAKEGSRVVASDVEENAARQTAETIRSQGGEAFPYVMDVSDSEQIADVAGRIRRDLGVPSVLVNNAGIAVGAFFVDTSPESWERIVAINLMGVVHCCRAFIPGMVESGQAGHVINIASMLAYSGIRGASAYCTTKFGVLGFSESLRAELIDHQIGVSAICPGMIRTNIINSSVLESSVEDVEEKRKAIDAMYVKRNYAPDRVGKAVIKAIRRNRAVVPVAPEAWLAWYLTRWTPWLARWLATRDFA
jgi:NAD(P)-dependent dehydrogenase (short-subunit alcohol dehydrogenase family)